MKPSDFEKVLAIARKHKVTAFEMGTLKVQFSSLALEPESAAKALAPLEDDEDIAFHSADLPEE